MSDERTHRAGEVLSTIEEPSIPVPTALTVPINGIGPDVLAAAQRDASDSLDRWITMEMDIDDEDDIEASSDEESDDTLDRLSSLWEPPDGDRRFGAFQGVETHEPTLQEVGDAESSLSSEPFDCRLQNLWRCIKKAGAVDF
jgi:hypothetical protein